MSKFTASTPSTRITDEQVGKFFDQLRHAVHDLGITGQEFQDLILEKERELRLRSRFHSWLQEVLAEAANTFVVVAKTVNYDLSPSEVIRASGRVEYLIDSVVATMPRLFTGIQHDVPAVLFKAGKYRSVEELEQEFERRDLVPDPYLQAAINAENKEFADKYPNGTQWDRDGKVASFLAFRRHFGDERSVHCDRDDLVWNVDWFGVGRRKS